MDYHVFDHTKLHGQHLVLVAVLEVEQKSQQEILHIYISADLPHEHPKQTEPLLRKITHVYPVLCSILCMKANKFLLFSGCMQQVKLNSKE